MICTNCNQNVPDTANVCGYCGHRLKEAVPPRPTSTSAAPAKSLAIDRPAWQPILLIAVGWGLGFGTPIGLVNSTIIEAAIIASIGGFITGLALHWVYPSFRWKHVAATTLGWAIAMVILQSIIANWPTIIVTPYLFERVDIIWAISSSIDSDPDFFISQVIKMAIGGSTGGIVTGSALRRTHPSFRWVHAAATTLGWAIAMVIGWYIGQVIIAIWRDLFGGSGLFWIVTSSIIGAILGTIGGVVMFWQLGLARQRYQEG